AAISASSAKRLSMSNWDAPPCPGESNKEKEPRFDESTDNKFLPDLEAGTEEDDPLLETARDTVRGERRSLNDAESWSDDGSSVSSAVTTNFFFGFFLGLTTTGLFSS